MIPALEDCRPGLHPTGFNILVVVEPVQQQTSGGLWKPDSVTSKEQLVEVRGRIVAMSPAAFDFASWPEGTRPEVGDAIQFAKLGGIMTKGADGLDYRLLLDKDVSAIVDEAAFTQPAKAA